MILRGLIELVNRFSELADLSMLALRVVTARVPVGLSGSFTSQIKAGPKLK